MKANTDTAVAATTMTDELNLEPDDDDAGWRDMMLLSPNDQMAEADQHPALRNISTGMIFTTVLRTEEPEPPEYVTLPINDQGRGNDDWNLDLAVSRWNMQWEAAQFRRRTFDEDELPSPIAELADQGDINIMFVPRTRPATSSTHHCSTCCPQPHSIATACPCCGPVSGRS